MKLSDQAGPAGSRGRPVPLTRAAASYRHGDLRRALANAGVALAREGGPRAVVLREATRRAGVAPNAAYRHFTNHQALFDAVRGMALAAVARAMERELETAERLPDPAARARAMVAAIGRGYLGFAQRETGLFRTAFFGGGAASTEWPEDARPVGDSGRDPLQLLGYALDASVLAGVLPTERRPGAEFLAWSAVHGMALLLIDGPLKGVSAAQREALVQRLLAMVEKGL